MGREYRCINGHPVNVEDPRLIFGAKTFKGSNILCWDCFDQDIGPNAELNKWLDMFITRHTDPMILAARKIAELEAANEQLRRVVDDQRRILKLQEAK